MRALASRGATRPTVRPPDEVVRLEQRGDGDRLAAPWLDLLARLGWDDYCLTPDWALSWWETTGACGDARVALWYDGDGRAEAVVPLFLHRERLHSRVPVTVSAWVNLGAGRGNADHLRLLSVAERATDVVAWLDRFDRRRPLLLHSLDPASYRPPGHGPARATVVERVRCPRLELGSDDPVPAPFRRKLTYYRRRLEREGFSFETTSSPGDVTPELLGNLFDLHEARWEASLGSRPGHLRARAEFFGQLVARGAAGRGPTLVVARRDGDVAGVLLGFWSGGTYAYFQNGWDPTYASLSLGSVLVDSALAAARDGGARTFDFMRGTTDFKYRFGAHDRIDESVLVPSGVGGALLRWKYTTGREVARRYAEPSSAEDSREVEGSVR